MTRIIERFLEELDNGFDIATLETEICNEAFDNNAECECVYGGSYDYFDTHMMQWYPGDGAEYEVNGYNDYINEIVDNLSTFIADRYGVVADDELKADVKKNLTDIFQDCVLSDDDFEDKAIEEYENY